MNPCEPPRWVEQPAAARVSDSHVKYPFFVTCTIWILALCTHGSGKIISSLSRKDGELVGYMMSMVMMVGDCNIHLRGELDPPASTVSPAGLAPIMLFSLWWLKVFLRLPKEATEAFIFYLWLYLELGVKSSWLLVPALQWVYGESWVYYRVSHHRGN